MDRLIVKTFIGLILVIGWRIPLARAAEPAVRLVGPVGQIQTGTISPVEVRIDTSGININAVELTLAVVGEGTEVVRLGRESSIMTLWPEPPAIDSAIVRFVGGRPGGVVAVDALVGTIFVIARQAGPVSLKLQPLASGFYRHDGAGTKVDLGETSVDLQVADDLLPRLDLTSTTHQTEKSWGRAGAIDVAWVTRPDEQFSYRLSKDISQVPDDDLDATVNPLRFAGLDDGIWYFVIKRRMPGEPWSPVYQRRFQLDRTTPEEFRLTQPDPKTVGGNTILTWLALDQMAGIAEYQGLVGEKTIGTVTSPLALKPDWSGQVIQVVAIDAAGNQRASEPWRYGSRRETMPWWGWTLIGLALVGLLLAVGRIVKRR